MNGIIFDIQRYSIHDGPGIRTVVFLKGCPLHCIWCCNPESQCGESEIEYRATKCTHCSRCVAVCPNGVVNQSGDWLDRGRCKNCFACARACPNGARRVIGERISVEGVLAEILKDRAFYRHSGGGVTLSGGEPLAQSTFAAKILKACYENNIHTAIETTSAVPRSAIEQVLPYTELFLCDIKHMDSAEHKKLTGVPNERILENISFLAASGARVVLRLPLIPNLNSDVHNLSKTGEFAARNKIQELHIMPFHQLGKDKYRRIGRAYVLSDARVLQQEELQNAKEILESYGVEVAVGG